MNDNCSNKRGAVRLELEGKLFACVEDWPRQQSIIASRKEAVIQLLAQALAAAPAAQIVAA